MKYLPMQEKLFTKPVYSVHVFFKFFVQRWVLNMHTEVYWRSGDYVLRQDVRVFPLNKKSELANHLVGTDWLSELAYLIDMFGNLNELNLSLQGRNKNIITYVDKVTAFMKKIYLWGV
jgi:hypothetical protein